MTTVSSVAEFVQQITALDNSLIRDGGPMGLDTKSPLDEIIAKINEKYKKFDSI